MIFAIWQLKAADDVICNSAAQFVTLSNFSFTNENDRRLRLFPQMVFQLAGGKTTCISKIVPLRIYFQIIFDWLNNVLMSVDRLT